MKKSHKKFIKKFKKYLKSAPDLRLTQALFDVSVVLPTDADGPHPHLFQDTYNEEDEVILERMKNHLKHGKRQKRQQKAEKTANLPSGS